MEQQTIKTPKNTAALAPKTTAAVAKKKGVSESWTVRWTNTSSRRIDTKALKAAMPDVAERFTKVTAGRRFTVTKVEVGDSG